MQYITQDLKGHFFVQQVTIENITKAMRNLQNIDFKLDTSLRSRATIGFVALATDQTIEHEVCRLISNNFPGVGCFTTRVQNDTTVTQESLGNMEQHLSSAVKSLLPGKAYHSYITYPFFMT